jgi:AcrR family transcriptional regulator
MVRCSPDQWHGPVLAGSPIRLRSSLAAPLLPGAAVLPSRPPLRGGNQAFTIGKRLITTRPVPTRDRILEAAVELFGRQGYHGTSVGEIERAAGLTPRSGALYKHFPSKEALLEAAMEGRSRVVDELEALVAATPLAEPRADVAALVRIAFREIGRDQQLLRIVMREGDNFPELRDRFHDRIVRRGHAQTAERLRLLAAAAGVEDLDLDALAAVLLAPIISYRVLETLFGRPPGDVDEERYLDTWTRSASSLLEAHGLIAGATEEEASE